MAQVAYKRVEQQVPETQLRPAPAERAYAILYFGFIALPIIAGADKFTHLLVNWEQYFSPFFASLMGPIAPYFMEIVGVVEIAAGVLVAMAPRIGGYVVAGWLGCIIVNLLSFPGYFDVAARDFGLALGALALAQLAEIRDR